MTIPWRLEPTSDGTLVALDANDGAVLTYATLLRARGRQATVASGGGVARSAVRQAMPPDEVKTDWPKVILCGKAAEAGDAVDSISLSSRARSSDVVDPFAESVGRFEAVGQTVVTGLADPERPLEV